MLQPDSYSGVLRPIISHGAARWTAAHEAEHWNADLLHDLSAKIDSAVTDETLRGIYEEAIAELRCQLSLVLSRDHRTLDILDAFVWQFVVAENFMPLLKQMKQEAVVIFAHSCIIINALEGHRWLQGWGTFLLSRAWEILDDEHRLWIQWPIEEIGWVAP